MVMQFVDPTILDTGPHGGIVKPAQQYNIEVKTAYPSIYAYLLDDKKNPISNKKIECTISFLMPDNTNFDVQPKPYLEDGFVVESGSTVYHSCRVTFNVQGKSVSALFENQNVIVQKNNPTQKK